MSKYLDTKIIEISFEISNLDDCKVYYRQVKDLKIIRQTTLEEFE